MFSYSSGGWTISSQNPNTKLNFSKFPVVIVQLLESIFGLVCVNICFPPNASDYMVRPASTIAPW